VAENPILIGTAGWSYPDWEAVVYPPGRPAERLATVARYLDCVEIDSSFYRPPTPQMTQKWVKALADRPEFRFLAKAWQRFTHERATRWSQAEFDLFTRGLKPLQEAGRLDALLFQFPWSFRYSAENRDWLRQIAEAFADWPVAVEFRHDSWLREKTLEFLRSNRITLCHIDQPALAHCIRPGTDVTTDTGYYRLHGRNAKNWFREKQEVYGGRYDYLYSEAELGELLSRIKRVAEKTKRTFVIFNNHKDAKAFSNALQLKARLTPGAKLRAPATLLSRYPVLRACATAEGEEQLQLV
jgi:uncharacterized protein YecE (DUF72 family)